MENNLKTYEPTISYHELIMVLDNLENTKNYPLPNGYEFVFWENEKDLQSWINIHISTGEFASITDCEKTFYDFYKHIENELTKRVIFIKDIDGNKIATATLSPANENGYSCVIDWFAISNTAQGKKLSKPLLSKIIDITKNFGYEKILLHTQTNSWLAAKVYLDFGFVPFNTNETLGWKILKSIINHPKLKDFEVCEDIFDPLAVNIKNQLSKIYKTFDFNVWYKNGRNDIYVHSNQNFHEYKFYDNGNKIVKVK